MLTNCMHAFCKDFSSNVLLFHTHWASQFSYFKLVIFTGFTAKLVQCKANTFQHSVHSEPLRYELIHFQQ